MLKVGNGVSNGLHEGSEIILKLLYFGVDYLLVHLPSGLLIDKVVVDVFLLRESPHVEGHFLLIYELSNVNDIGVDIMATELFF